ncbi:MAG: hypothetical protein EOO99_09485 [Pedobacter sp.]|nr:MAG: hypothetical protein EOO99_09485 [Pedobacter sp.]
MFNFKNEHIHRIQNLDSIRADFSIINEFDWDAMVIIGHYTSKDKINALDLKNTWSIRNEIAAMSSIDFHELIIFLKGKNVVRYAKLKGIRFSTANGEPPFPKIISKKELASYYIFNREKSNIYFELIAPKNID